MTLFHVSEPWDYVSFRKVDKKSDGEIVRLRLDNNRGNMPSNNSHPHVNYQVANKQELDVIYEGRQPPKSNKTVILVIVVVIVLVIVGGGVGVALWQTGLFSSDSSVISDSDHVRQSSSTSSSSSVHTSTARTVSSDNNAGEKLMFLLFPPNVKIFLIS